MRTRLDLRTRAEGKGIDWSPSYYRGGLYIQTRSHGRTIGNTWTKHKGRVAMREWPSDQVAM